MESNFQITGNGTPVTATAVSQRISVPASTRDVLVTNPGPNVVRVRAGGATVAATAQSMPVLAGEKGVYNVGYGATHLALIAPAGDQAVEVFFGEGS